MTDTALAPDRTSADRGRGRAGYTVVELLMSLTVLALGASGVIAMQREEPGDCDTHR